MENEKYCAFCKEDKDCTTHFFGPNPCKTLSHAFSKTMARGNPSGTKCSHISLVGNSDPEIIKWAPAVRHARNSCTPNENTNGFKDDFTDKIKPPLPLGQAVAKTINSMTKRKPKAKMPNEATIFWKNDFWIMNSINNPHVVLINPFGIECSVPKNYTLKANQGACPKPTHTYIDGPGGPNNGEEARWGCIILKHNNKPKDPKAQQSQIPPRPLHNFWGKCKQLSRTSSHVVGIRWAIAKAIELNLDKGTRAIIRSGSLHSISKATFHKLHDGPKKQQINPKHQEIIAHLYFEISL